MNDRVAERTEKRSVEKEKSHVPAWGANIFGKEICRSPLCIGFVAGLASQNRVCSGPPALDVRAMPCERALRWLIHLRNDARAEGLYVHQPQGELIPLEETLPAAHRRRGEPGEFVEQVVVQQRPVGMSVSG